MTQEELTPIVEKYQRLSDNSQDEEKSYMYNRFTEFLEDYTENLAEDETEKSLWDHFLEVEDESENWEDMFPEGDDDDSITDWLTKE